RQWLSLDGFGGVLDDVAVLHDQRDVGGVGEEFDVVERVAGGGDQVGPFARLQRADLVAEPTHVGGGGGACHDRVHGRESGVDQVCQLDQVLAVGDAEPGVGSGRDPHPGLDGHG